MAKIKFYTFNLKEVNYNWLDGKMEKDDLFNNWSDSTYELGRELELITQFVLQFRAHCWQTDEHFLTTFNQWRQQFNIQSITNFNIMTYAEIDLWRKTVDEVTGAAMSSKLCKSLWKVWSSVFYSRSAALPQLIYLFHATQVLFPNQCATEWFVLFVCFFHVKRRNSIPAASHASFEREFVKHPLGLAGLPAPGDTI